jgi:hypothetical protein
MSSLKKNFFISEMSIQKFLRKINKKIRHHKKKRMKKIITKFWQVEARLTGIVKR